MRMLEKAILTLATIIFLMVGIASILLSIHWFTWDEVQSFLGFIAGNKVRQIGLFTLGFFLITISFSIWIFSFLNRHREQTIAFRNSLGEVRISLAALEDFIKKIASEIPEVKSIRSRVSASKKGLEVRNTVTLWSNNNISDVANDLQFTIKKYLQDILGIERVNQIKVLVSNISLESRRIEEIMGRMSGRK